MKNREARMKPASLLKVPIFSRHRFPSFPAGWPMLILLVLYCLDFHFDVRGRDVFSWMDPSQYYRFALEFFNGISAYNEFELPSIFPFFLYPIMKLSTSIPAALWVNVCFAALMAVGVYSLCRQLEIRTQPFIVTAVILACPLMLGLSRELYTEFSLTAIVAVQLRSGFKTDDFTRPRFIVLFALLFGVGVLTKMTYPLFFIWPFIGEAAVLVRKKRYKRLLSMAAGFTIPLAGVLLIEKQFFPLSFRYYLSLGHTSIPIMYMIGPPKIFSLESIVFYYSHLWKTMLLLLTPFLLVPLLQIPRLRLCFTKAHSRRDMLLWLWLLGPITLLILQLVKEPRHVAPCVIPAALLIFRGIEQLKSANLRRALILAVLVGATGNYFLVTRHVMSCPYFLDTPVYTTEIERAMQAADPDYARAIREGKTTPVHWKFTKNIVITGFEANTALAITWHFYPAIVYDLDLFQSKESRSANIPYETFEDLYTLTSFNIYNRRCKWFEYYKTLEKKTVLRNADYAVLKGASVEEAARLFPEHTMLANLPAKDGAIIVVKLSDSNTESYRTLYGREFLRRGKNLEHEDLNAIHFEMFMAALPRQELSNPDELLGDFPAGFKPIGKMRNIYYYGAYQALFQPYGPVYIRYLQQLHSGAK